MVAAEPGKEHVVYLIFVWTQLPKVVVNYWTFALGQPFAVVAVLEVPTECCSYLVLEVS